MHTLKEAHCKSEYDCDMEGNNGKIVVDRVYNMVVRDR